jgi:hypothetical protein
MYCTALKNLYLSILCILIAIVSFFSLLLIGGASEARANSLIFLAGTTGPACPPDFITGKNNQLPDGVAFIIIGTIEKEHQDFRTPGSGEYVFVSTPVAYRHSLLSSSVNLLSGKTRDAIFKSNERMEFL